MTARLALLAASVLFSLALGEAALRVYYLMSSTGVLEDLQDDRPLPRNGAVLSLGDLLLMSPDPGIIYQGRPGVEGTLKGVPVRINSRGWREQEIPYEKPPGTFRIVGIGDSVQFGWRVAEDERYLDRLEARLQREFPERRWETVVLALSGYNLMNELHVLRRAGLRYEPDLILYGYIQNDSCLPRFVSESLRAASLQSFIAYYARQGFASRARPVGWAKVIDRSGVDEEDKVRCEAARVPEHYRHLMGIENLKAAVVELAELSRASGIPVAILFDGRRGEPNPFAEFVPEGIVVVDLHEHFSAYLSEQGLPDYRHARLRQGGKDGADHHPTAEAHGVIAEGLFEALVAAGLVP
jgi:hypothetical protein